LNLSSQHRRTILHDREHTEALEYARMSNPILKNAPASTPTPGAGNAINGNSTGATPVIDYEGSAYQTDFWTGQGREYEDAAERIALGKLVPGRGRRIAEIGAGFGRLGELYLGYEQIVLMDYSRTLLASAAERWGKDPRFVFVAGNIYQLPLASQVLDTLVMVRVMHHLADVPAALTQLRRATHSGSTLVIEYANKRNLKSLMRWAARKQDWSPIAREPLEFVELNFDFHPSWMEDRFTDAGLKIRKQYGVSHFRLGALKQRVSPAKLAQADSLLFGVGGHVAVAPSIFVQAQSIGSQPRANAPTAPERVAELFRCPECARNGLTQIDVDQVQCPECGARYAKVQHVWDFKAKI